MVGGMASKLLFLKLSYHFINLFIFVRIFIKTFRL
jgi:hypothetical protein